MRHGAFHESGAQWVAEGAASRGAHAPHIIPVKPGQDDDPPGMNRAYYFFPIASLGTLIYMSEPRLAREDLLLIFDGCISGTEIFSERIQTLMNCRRHVTLLARAAE